MENNNYEGPTVVSSINLNAFIKEYEPIGNSVMEDVMTTINSLRVNIFDKEMLVASLRVKSIEPGTEGKWVKWWENYFNI